MEIHPSSLVSPKAKIGKNLKIGAFSIIGEDVTIGDNCDISPYTEIIGKTILGKNNEIGSFCHLGGKAQDLIYGDSNGEVIIGDDNIIREYSTVHRGTEKDKQKTIIGNKNYFMVNTHIGHDCVIGDSNIMGQNCALGGHTQVGNYAYLGAYIGVHQRCRIGDYSFISRNTTIVQDVPPFVKCAGPRASTYGLNYPALNKAEFSAEVKTALKKIYRIYFRQPGGLTDLLESPEARELCREFPEAKYFFEFIKDSVRGITH